MDMRFELGKPFQPFEQLMGVFPAARSVLVYIYEYCSDCGSVVGNKYQKPSIP